MSEHDLSPPRPPLSKIKVTVTPAPPREHTHKDECYLSSDPQCKPHVCPSHIEAIEKFVEMVITRVESDPDRAWGTAVLSQMRRELALMRGDK
jgi:hypothetical protein